MRTVVPLIVFMSLVAAAAFIGARFTPGEWYDSLQRPPLAPPNWIFGPVWTLLYLAIAVAGFLVWRSPETSRLALVLWGTQLTLNALWSYLVSQSLKNQHIRIIRETPATPRTYDREEPDSGTAIPVTPLTP